MYNKFRLQFHQHRQKVPQALFGEEACAATADGSMQVSKYGSPEGPSIVVYHFDHLHSILPFCRLPFYISSSINARIITHMRKFIIRTQRARRN